MFSLRSNSIESRFRSILWGCFYTDTCRKLNTAKTRSKQKWIRCAHEIFFLAMLFLGSNFCINSVYTQNQIHKKTLFRESRREFCRFTRRHSFC